MTCRIGGCSKLTEAREMCSLHYGRWLRGDRGERLARPKRRYRNHAGPCVVEGCSRTGHKARGMCRMHYARWQRGERGEVLARPTGTSAELWEKYGATCRIRGCEEDRRSRGLCNTHYARWLAGDRGWHLRRPLRELRAWSYDDQVCEKPACEERAHTRLLCEPHYTEWRRRLQGWFNRALKSGPCTDCGRWLEWYVKEFDHCRGDKKVHVTSSKTIHKQIAESWKCDPVCANCHRRRTHRRRVA